MVVQQLKSAFVMLLLFTCLTGIAYPLLVTVSAQMLFPSQANGSLIINGNLNKGSELIGQPFTRPEYFWGRPSATAPIPYNAGASSGSNLGATNPVLIALVQSRISTLQIADPDNKEPIPIDLITASGSGLDPHISPAAALYQVNRIAKRRHIEPVTLQKLLHSQIEERQMGFLGEPRVNVLKLNLLLDQYQSGFIQEVGANYPLSLNKANLAQCKKEALILIPGEIGKERLLDRNGRNLVEYVIQVTNGEQKQVLCDLNSGKLIRELNE